MTSIKMKSSQSNSHDDTIDTEPMDLAIQFLHDHPSENAITAARIYNVNVNSLRSIIRRAKVKATRPTPIHGGHNKILSEAQIKAIYKYIEDSYHAGYGASKSMVKMAITHLRAAELPPKPEPSWLSRYQIPIGAEPLCGRIKCNSKLKRKENYLQEKTGLYIGIVQG